MTPIVIGSTQRQTATQLAEAAIQKMLRNRSYSVGMDLAGRIIIAGVDDIQPSELLMVCTNKSDPDILADNIRAEVNDRDPNYKPRSHRVIAQRKRA